MNEAKYRVMARIEGYVGGVKVFQTAVPETLGKTFDTLDEAHDFLIALPNRQSPPLSSGVGVEAPTMTDEHATSSTCGECRIRPCPLDGPCTCPQPVILCPLHAGAEERDALLEALERLLQTEEALLDEEHCEELDGAGCPWKLARAAIAAAQPKHVAQEGEAG
jgi:hypothetical protein